MVDFQEDTTLTSGSWYLWRTGRKKVLLACPACGGISMVNIVEVAFNGKVLRDFWCRAKGCFFTDEIRLVGWRAES